MTSGDMHPVWQLKNPDRLTGNVTLKGLSITVLEMNVER